MRNKLLSFVLFLLVGTAIPTITEAAAQGQQLELLPGHYKLSFYVMDRRKYITELEFKVNEQLQLESLRSQLQGRERCNGALASYQQAEGSQLTIQEAARGTDTAGCAKLSYQLQFKPQQAFEPELKKRLASITVLLNGKAVATQIQNMDYRAVPLASFISEHKIWTAQEVFATGNPSLIERYQRAITDANLTAQAQAAYQQHSSQDYEVDKAWARLARRISGVKPPATSPEQKAAAQQAQHKLLDKIRRDAEQLAQPESSFAWRTQAAFGANYFDVFYEQGLLLALPSLYANNLWEDLDHNVILVDKQSCKKTDQNKFANLLRARLRGNSFKDSPLFRQEQQVGTMGQLYIDDTDNWRLPHQDEIRSSMLVSRWHISNCATANSNMFLSRTEDGFRAFGYSIKQGVTNDYKPITYWEQSWTWDGENLFALVREPLPIEQQVFADSKLTTEQRISLFADLLSKEALTAVRSSPVEPELEAEPEAPAPLQRDEFETSEQFAQRQQALERQHQDAILQVQERNRVLISAYDAQLQQAEQDYLAQQQLFERPDFQAKVRWLAYNEALQRVLGNPYFTELKYDADNQRMHAVVISAQAQDYRQQVSFAVGLEQARSLKQQLQNSELIPALQLDHKLAVQQVEMVANSNRVELDYLVAVQRDTIDGFTHFMREHPQTEQYQAAAQRKSELIENARRKEEERQRQLAEAERQRQLEREAERRAYMEPKQLGDLVCKPASLAFGLIKQEISAHVEQVSGDRIQLRIANTGGQSIHYQGVPLYVGGLIWDQYYEWKKCR